jgi:hypothetical protein
MERNRVERSLTLATSAEVAQPERFGIEDELARGHADRGVRRLSST